MFVPKGYYVGSSYIGFLPGNLKMRFATEQEYLEYVDFYDFDNEAKAS